MTIDEAIKNLLSKSDNFNSNSDLEIFKNTPLDQKEEKFKLILQNLKPGLELNKYINVLPAELRLKYVNSYDFNEYRSYYSIIEGINDEDIIYKLLVYALSKIDSDYNISNMFELVPSKYRETFLLLIAQKERNLEENMIQDYNFSKYISCFDINDRPNVIKNILFKYFNYDFDKNKLQRVSEYYYKDILETVVEDGVEFKESKIYDILLFLIDEQRKIIDPYNNNKPTKIFNVNDILNVFLKNNYDIKEVLKILIDQDIVETYMVIGINKELPDNLKMDITSFVVDYYISIGKKLDDYRFYSFIRNLNDNECVELFNKYVVKEKKYSYGYALRDSSDALFFANQLFSLLTPEEIDEEFETINAFLSLNGEEFSFSKGYENVIKVYSEKYNVNYSGLYKFIQKFSFTVLKYLPNEKIRKYINLSSFEIDKLFNIFNDDNYYFDKSIKNDIVNSLYQREFMMKEKDIYNIFSKFEEMVANNDSLGVKDLINFIQKSYDINILLIKNNITYEEFFHQVMSGDFDILHQITDKFIALKREEYIREKLVNVDENLIMDKIISRESYKKDIVENHKYAIALYLSQLDKSLFTREQLFLIENENILNELIEFKKNPKEYNLSAELRRYLKTFSELLDILYDNKKGIMIYDPNFEEHAHIQFVHVQQEVKNEYLLGILVESNFDGLCNILNDESLHLKLVEFLHKYKMIGWQYTFNNILESCSMDYSEATIAGLISNFDKIIDKIEDKATLTSIIDYSNCYSSSSKLYSLIFGREDFNLIAANTGKNKASMSKYERLRRNVDLIIKMYDREYVTTPSIHKNFSVENNKSIEVVLGNSTNMMNLTYGERTNSCMRQGGSFNDLFHYCIENENGFHIRFTNPRTGKFVSRVSGLRNGNTVFLNELRISLDDEYTNEDLYVAIKKVSEYLIDITKDSKAPIENVLITTDYALDSKKEEEINLGLTNEELGEALQKIRFNFKEKALLLASSNKDGSIVKYNFNIDLPKYGVEKDDIKIYKGQNAINRMLQLKLINGILNGKEIDKIDIEESIDIPNYLISGEDFYLAFKNGNIDIFVLDKSRDNIKTKEQIEKILNSGHNLEEKERSINL